jgi:hypothetical protein
VFAKVLEDPALGATVKDRDHYVKTGGLPTRTSIDRGDPGGRRGIDKHGKPSDTASRRSRRRVSG